MEKLERSYQKASEKVTLGENWPNLSNKRMRLHSAEPEETTEGTKAANHFHRLESPLPVRRAICFCKKKSEILSKLEYFSNLKHSWTLNTINTIPCGNIPYKSIHLLTAYISTSV